MNNTLPDDSELDDEIVQTEVPAVPGKQLSLVEQIRASLAKPGKYVMNCQEMTDEDWENLYPPNVKELASLKGSGLPEWHYEWSYCTHCHNQLRSCVNNPYGFHGAIGKARIAARSSKTEPAKVASISEAKEKPKLVAVESPTPVQPAPQPVQPAVAAAPLKKTVIQMVPAEPVKTGFGRGKPRTTIVVSPEIVTKVAAMLKKGQGGGMVAIAKTLNVNPNELSAALKAVGVELSRGRKSHQS